MVVGRNGKLNKIFIKINVVNVLLGGNFKGRNLEFIVVVLLVSGKLRVDFVMLFCEVILVVELVG